MNVIKYPSIGQFRNLVKDVQFANKEHYPILKMVGTVKVHGTNASVVISPGGYQYPQSRNNILTIEDDNHGFANWHTEKKDLFNRFSDDIAVKCPVSDHSSIIIYGEWAGKGIQGGVAVSEANKFFYIFSVKTIDPDGVEKWLADYPVLDNGVDVLDSREIWQKEIEIDFNVPVKVQNELVEITKAIELECPVGKALGYNGIGEGVVWVHITENGERFTCKVKGEKHSSSKVKKLAEVDTEKLNSIDEFVAYAVTEPRLKQAFSEVCNNDADRKLLGPFIKWVSSDINKEESDTLEASGLTMRDVGSPLSRRARDWFFAQEEL